MTLFLKAFAVRYLSWIQSHPLHNTICAGFRDATRGRSPVDWVFVLSSMFFFYAFRHVRCTAQRPGDHCWHWRCGLCGRRRLGPLSIAQTSRGISVETQHGQWVPRGATNSIRGRWFPLFAESTTSVLLGVNLDGDIHVGGNFWNITMCLFWKSIYI